MSTRLLLLGVGSAAHAVSQYAMAYDTKYGTTRNPDKVLNLRESGLVPLVYDRNDDTTFQSIVEAAVGAHVVVSFPPSEEDARFAEAIRDADKIVYVSSTGVYGTTSGVITEETPVERSADTQARLGAEAIWREQGAIVLRAPALYGPEYGMHLSLASGRYRLPGDGSGYSSRIHLYDLARIILKCLSVGERQSTYVVGDEKPAPQAEVVSWLCSRMNLDAPLSIPLQEAHITQRANRRITAGKVLKDMDITLDYPTYEIGFEHCIRHSVALAEILKTRFT